MSAKDVVFGLNARARLASGFNLLADAVKLTLGPRGRHAAVERGAAPPVWTKDGVTVARELSLGDPLHNMGVQLATEVSARTGDSVGDGTTTAIVLAQAIAREGLKHEASGFSPIDLKRGIDLAVNAIVEQLAALARPVATSSEIAQVATVSANGDTVIGKLIAEAYERVGRDGVITVEDGPTLDDELTVAEGLQFARGYLSPYFINDAARGVAELERPLILLADQKLDKLRDLLPVLELAAQAARPLLIIAEEIAGDALAGLVLNHSRGVLKVLAVKAPGYGERRRTSLEDLAALTGARLLSSDSGLTLATLTLADLGQARRVEAGKEHTTIIDGSGAAEAIASRSEQIQAEISATSAGYDRDQLQQRLAGLAGGVAVIRLGAATESEMAEKKARLEDALHATRAAVAEGVVAGGGVALLRARQALPMLRGANSGQDAGIAILLRAIEAPLRQIAVNAGVSPSVVLERVLQETGHVGYNAADDSYGDLVELGVLDPTRVTRVALQSAASVAGLLLTTAAGIYAIPQPRDPHDDHHHEEAA
ncbi:chaperonin GroEL [Duganella sacchari]|uniref:Chaperonin GroEL n=1 Tax=Duganella sacchari TaxID=551987 RepID=A0A1M7TAE7_9BURK|nr:chaperonin GroEL [Duganella sacchari]SHN67617.1 chaperonin GroEL [Duganella sacchari]